MSSSSSVSERRRPIPELDLARDVSRLYLRFLLPELPFDPFVLAAERLGISLFYRELDFSKSQLVDLLQKFGGRNEREDPSWLFSLVDQTVSRYARPIKDNIDYTRSLSDLRKRRSEVYGAGLFKEVRTLMGGDYVASNDEIEFRSVTRGPRRFVIPLHLASSSARGLSDLYFFLRHVARRDHLLIIDEPESHLDTANQILLARLLARAVKAGVRVLLTTHSDYLIKELNNLIMLSSNFPNKAEVAKRLNYEEADYLESGSSPGLHCQGQHADQVRYRQVWHRHAQLRRSHRRHQQRRERTVGVAVCGQGRVTWRWRTTWRRS